MSHDGSSVQHEDLVCHKIVIESHKIGKCVTCCVVCHIMVLGLQKVRSGQVNITYLGLTRVRGVMAKYQ